jgi:hypothetical protein
VDNLAKELNAAGVIAERASAIIRHHREGHPSFTRLEWMEIHRVSGEFIAVMPATNQAEKHW